MTLLATAPPAAPTSVGSGAAAPDPTGRARLVTAALGPMTTTLVVMLLVFVTEMVFLGAVTHARAQSTLYADFRSQLADGVAPTGQLGADGALLGLGSPVALMTVDKLGLKEVVAEGTTAQVLKAGPGHRRDSALPGQLGTTVVYGRQAAYGGPFARVAELVRGDEISFRTGQGSATYRVTGVRHPGDPAPPATYDAARLVLGTAEGIPYLAERVVFVDAELTSEPFPSPPRPIGAAALLDSEKPLAGDRSGLLGLLLWAELLLVVAVLLAWVRAVWGRWQTWLVSVPVLGILGFQVAGPVAQLLPNML